jgi:hypothetical protein
MTSILKVNTIQDTDGNNIINENSNAVTIGKAADTVSIPGNATLGASGKTITIPSGCTITNNGTQSGFGGVNTPAFRSYYSGSHTIADSTNTELHFNTEVFDVGSCYDTSNGRFTPTTAGKYFLYVKLKVQLGGGIVYVEFRKNGSAVHSNYENISSRPSGDYGFQLSTIQEANGSSDYFLINYYQGSGSGKTLYGGTDSGWMGYKLIE